MDVAPAKRAKSGCVIHATDDDTNLIKPKDLASWQSLHEAAVTLKHTYLLGIASRVCDGEVPDHVVYHRRCRQHFLLKAKAKRSKAEELPEVERRTSKRSASNEDTLYPKECIICFKSKYMKGTRNKEPLVKCCIENACISLKKVAEEKNDHRMLGAMNSKEFIAGEAHYHRTCYKDYTRQHVSVSSAVKDETYKITEDRAYNQLFTHIRCELFQHPKVVQLTDLADMLSAYMGEIEMTDSTKKHFRRNIELEFEDSLHIINIDRRTLVYPSTLQMVNVIKENVVLKNEIDKLQKKDTDILKTASVLRSAIKQSKYTTDWPPNPLEVGKEHVNIPNSVTQFLSVLVTGDTDQKDVTSKASNAITSIGQDIIYAVMKGRTTPPKHILIAAAVKTLTGNVELIKILNRLGHCISYTKYEDIDTALCLKKLSQTPEEGVPLPSNIMPGVYTCLGWDNIDRQEETLSGGGTSHRVNGIAVQPLVYGPQLPPPDTPDVGKAKKRTIEIQDDQIPEYNAGGRVGPPRRVFVDIDGKDCTSAAKMKNLVWLLARIHSERAVSSWTGFNMQVRNKIDIVQTQISYLPTVNAPATSLATVHEVLNQSLKIMDQLELKSIVCVFDQAFYAKATEVKWKHLDRFSPLVLRLGTFHTIGTLLNIIGKRFGDAGLQDLCIETLTVAQGSIQGLVEGRKYNRAVRVHKLVYEALHRLAWQQFLETYDNAEALQEMSERIQELTLEVNEDTFEELVADHVFKQVLNAFDKYLEHLRTSNGALSSFWMSYMDMVDIMLNFLRSSREADWKLHLASVRAMLPWCFAYDAINYARYMSAYYQDMMTLKEEHPEACQFLESGGFSVQMGTCNPFGRIPVDQTVEETVNKDTQTPGGTKGFSLNANAVQKYYLTAEYRTIFMRNMREMVSLTKQDDFDHPDLHKFRISKDEATIQKMCTLLQNSWKNPFSSEVLELMSISTGAVATEQIATDLEGAHGIGEKCYNQFKEERLQNSPNMKLFHDRLPNCKLKTFAHMKKVSKVVKIKGQETVLRADRNLFALMVLVAQNRKLRMEEVLKHPLGPLPYSLATNEGLPRKTEKAALGRTVVKSVPPAESIRQPSASLLDGMAIVHKISGDKKTLAEIASEVLARGIAEAGTSRRLDFVFDVYKDNSIKGFERLLRGQGTGIQYTNMARGHKIMQWREFLKDSTNKNNLIQFMVKEWQMETNRRNLNDKILYATAMETCVKITADNVEKINELECTHEEADTRLLLHAAHIARFNYESIIVHSDDTDVRLLFLAFAPQLPLPLYQKCKTSTRTTFIDITQVRHVQGDNISDALPGYHAFTGCDTVSAFAGKGKIAGMKILQKHAKYRELFTDLGQTWDIPDQVFEELQAFVCLLYGSKTACSDVNAMRFEMFLNKKGKTESHQLPPCKDTLFKHSLRACYQAGIWKRCLEASPDIPSPIGMGWCEKIEDGTEMLEIDWMRGKPAPEAVIELLACDCRSSCKQDKCPCIGNGIKCTQMCKLKDCENQDEQDDISEIRNHDGEDEDDEEDEEEDEEIDDDGN